MKTNCFSKNIRYSLFLVLLTIFSTIGLGQTIIQYDFNNTINPNPGYNVDLNPQLQYFDPPNVIQPNDLDYNGSFLLFENSGDYIEFTFDATNYEGLTLEARVGLWGFGLASANVKVYMQIGSGPMNLLPNGDVSLQYFFIGSQYHNFSIPLTGSDNQSLVKIRVVGTSNSWAIFDGFGTDYIRLVSNNTTMNVRRFDQPNTLYPIIPHEASASVTLDTDFGYHLTNEGSVVKRFRIRNTGNRSLLINSINIEPINQGFSILGSYPTSIPINQDGYFDVQFAPTNQGLQLANVVINSNAVPNNPFKFQVIGNGKSCNTSAVPILFQHFEGEGGLQSNLNLSILQGQPSTIRGTAQNPLNAPPGVSTLYPNGNLYAAGSENSSIYVRGTQTGTVELEFDPVDITGQTEVSIAFNVAAFGQKNDNDSGVNSSDYVILSVFNPLTNSYSEEIRLNGSNNSTRRKYNFNTGIHVPLNYLGTNNPHVRSNNQSNNSTNYTSFQLTIPPSYGSNTLKFKIKAYTSQTRTGTGWPWDPIQYHNYNFWLIDNVRVNAGNALAKTWNGSSWSGGSRPSSREKAIFNGNYNFSGTENQDLEVCECLVMWNKNITIPNGRAMTVRNRIDVQGQGDNFVVKTGGNLIQIEDNATNTGIIKVERHVVDMDVDLQNQMDYVYWGSPVGGQKLRGTATEGGFSPGTPNNRFFELREPQNMFASTPDAEFLPAKGYSIRAENGLGNPYNKTYVFKGSINNGIIESPALSNQNEGYNLIGNPYPSNINSDKLFDLNAGKIFNTILFWENKGYTQYQMGSNYDGNNYVVYNGYTGGIPGTEYERSYEISVNNIIPVGQGFLVKAKPDGAGQPILFDNSIRTKETGQFYQKYQKDRFWLTLESPNGTFNTMLLGYILGATNDFDEDYDVFPIYEEASDIIYSIADSSKMVIQARDFPLNREDVVPLGANFYQDGNYKIYLRGAEGIFAEDQDVFIRDKYTRKIHNLTEDGDFVFRAAGGEVNDRFEIIYKRKHISVSSLPTLHSSLISIDKVNMNISVSSSQNKLVNIEVYNLNGNRIYEIYNVNKKTFMIPSYNFKESIIFIRVIDELGQIETKKMILK